MAVGVVGGSDLVKITEQLGKSGLEPAKSSSSNDVASVVNPARF